MFLAKKIAGNVYNMQPSVPLRLQTDWLSSAASTGLVVAANTS